MSQTSITLFWAAIPVVLLRRLSCVYVGKFKEEEHARTNWSIVHSYMQNIPSFWSRYSCRGIFQDRRWSSLWNLLRETATVVSSLTCSLLICPRVDCDIFASSEVDSRNCQVFWNLFDCSKVAQDDKFYWDQLQNVNVRFSFLKTHAF